MNPENSQQKPVIILGAGVTGLITGWLLAKAGRTVTIIESSDTIGGLAKTYEWGGYFFDNGAHNFFTRDSGVLEFYNNTIPGLLIPRKRKFKLFIFGKLLTFPFLGTDILLAFGMKNLFLMGGSFLWARLKLFIRDPKPTESLEQWIIERYGKVLYRLYFREYLMLVQKADPKYLSAAIGAKKIPLMSIRKMAMEIYKKLLRKKTNPHHVSAVSYYCKKGIGEIPRFFYNELLTMPNVSIKLNEKVLFLRDGTGTIEGIQTDKEFYSTSVTEIVSTIPLPFLIRFEDSKNFELTQKTQKLLYSRMRFLFVKIKKPLVSGCWFVNFNDERFPFYRVSEEVYGEYDMVPDEGHSSLIFELSINDGDLYSTMSDEELTTVLIEKLNLVFPISMSDVTGFKSVFCNEANPRLIIHYREILEEVFNFLHSRNNIYSIGRQGFFTYANIDHCTRMALDFSEYFLKGDAKTGNRLLFENSKISGF